MVEPPAPVEPAIPAQGSRSAKAQVYYRRAIDRELDQLLPGIAALSLEGLRGTGKTATAALRAARVFRLDDPSVRDLVASQPGLVLQEQRPVLLDEWQHYPPIWDAVRRAVDDGAEGGSFLLTGSADPPDRGHTGAGRIVSVAMRPMTLSERRVAEPTVSLGALLVGDADIAGETDISVEDYVAEIVRSGFPGIRNANSPRAIRAQLDSYVARLLDHDLQENGTVVRRPATLRAWLSAYAAAVSTTASFETIRDSATGGQAEKPAKSTSIAYRDALTRLWVLEPVPAWLPGHNHLKRLASASKHQLADPALACRLLSVTADSLLGGQLAGKPVLKDASLLGRLFESLVTLSVRTYSQVAEARVEHLRTHGGEREVDLIVVGEANRVLAIEVKMTAVPDNEDVKHLHWLKSVLGDDLIDAVVITAGPYAYRRQDGIAVVPAALLGP